MLHVKKQKSVFFVWIFVLLMLLFFVSIGIAQDVGWIPKENIPTGRSWASSCLLDGKIYVIGGTVGTHYTGLAEGTMEVYDPTLDSWDTTKTDMPTPRVELCTAVVNGKIYAIGGALNHPGSTYGMVEEYDPLTNTWDTDKMSMPTPRKGMACGVIANKIYVAGGTAFSNYSPSNKLEIYDPATDTWDVTKTAMPKALYDPAGTVLNDTLYVVGGLVGSPWVGQKTVQIYDIATDSWSTGADLLYGRPGHSADALSGKIYVIGGDPQSVMVRDIEEYDPELNSWKVIDQAPHGITTHTSNVHNEKIYIFSGSTDDIFNLSPTNAVYAYDPIVSSLSQNNFTPYVFSLHQNYPNPFNPTTVISYQLPAISDVDLRIYNMLGQKVAALVKERQQAGFHQVNWDASGFASGVYYYRIEAGEFVDVRKMVFIR